jgi:hypothetical protein
MDININYFLLYQYLSSVHKLVFVYPLDQVDGAQYAMREHSHIGKQTVDKGTSTDPLCNRRHVYEMDIYFQDRMVFCWNVSSMVEGV